MPAQISALADVTPVFVRAAAVVAAATDVSTGVDLTGYDGVAQMVWSTGAITGTLDCSLEDSADNSSYAAFTANIGAVPAQITAANKCVSISFDVRSARRYIRAKSIVATTSCALAVCLIAQKRVTG